MNGEILITMDHAGRALKNANNGMTLEEVDEMMDEIQDAKDVADEINEAIARPLANSYVSRTIIILCKETYSFRNMTMMSFLQNWKSSNKKSLIQKCSMFHPPP